MSTSCAVRMIHYTPDGQRIFVIASISMRSERGSAIPVPRAPLELYYFECHADKQAAMRREYQIKQLSRSEKLKLKYRSEDV